MKELNIRMFLKGIIDGVGFALDGLYYAFLNDRHFKVNLVLSVLGVLLSIVFLSGCTKLMVAFFNYLVLVVETVNTAIEKAVDTSTTDFHPYAKASKDVSAAAVLLVGIFALVADIVYILPSVWRAMIDG